jgi:hypothetical protein
MTANKTIAAAVTIPKFASGVSWSCYSNGGSRSALSITCDDKRYSFAIGMCAPGAARNSDSYTWSNCGGKTITALSATSMTLNGVTRSVTTPGAGGSWTQKVNFQDIMSINSSSGFVAGSKTYTSGKYKAVFSWPGNSGSVAVTVKYYYSNSEKASLTVCTVRAKYDDEDGYEWGNPGLEPTGDSARNGTFASGVTGAAAGGYCVTEISWNSIHHASITAASGTGASRTITVKK